ncbi:MAG: YciI family protein [Geminicoccaceae bacterium]|nr:YciI family protein [Geminicoccaceae bacterium]
MAYILHCLDKPGSLELRKATRERHLDYLKGTAVSVLLGGAMLGPDGAPVGSLLVVDAADEAEVERFVEADPYAKAGLFQTVEIRAFNPVVGSLLAS